MFYKSVFLLYYNCNYILFSTHLYLYIMSLTIKELNSLLNILEEDGLGQKTFENVATSFHHSFNKQDHFRIGSSLVLLLQNKDMLVTKEQRLMAIFLLYEMYRTEPIQANPFASVFIHLLHPPDEVKSKQTGLLFKKPWALPKFTGSEKYFLSQLISMPTKDLFKKTPQQVLQMDDSDMQSFDVSGLQVALAERHSEMSQTSKSGIPAVLQAPDDKSVDVMDANILKTVRESLLCGIDAPVQACYKPKCIRLAPPLHAFDDELVWMNPTNPAEHKVMWDSSMCVNNTAGIEAKRLIAKAFKSSLTINQQQQLLSELEADPKIVYHIGLTPGKFPDLVENNPNIAVEVLLKLYSMSSQISEYLAVLLNMGLSVHSMEVVNRLTTSIELPADFVHLYISNCINSCQTVKDKYIQNRLVRLVCVFLQSLIRNDILDVQIQNGRNAKVTNANASSPEAQNGHTAKAANASPPELPNGRSPKATNAPSPPKATNAPSPNEQSTVSNKKLIQLSKEAQDFLEIECKAFCIEYSHIREAAALFRTIDQLLQLHKQQQEQHQQQNHHQQQNDQNKNNS